MSAIDFQLSLKSIENSPADRLTKIIRINNLMRADPSNDDAPLIYLVASLAGPGRSYLFNIRFANSTLFYFILIFSVYFLGKRIFRKRVGLFAAFLVSFYPMVYAYSRHFMQDFPLTATVAFCLMLLVYTETYSGRFYSLLFGFCLGIATLVKLQVLFFLALPMFYLFLRAFFLPREERKRRWLNFSLVVLISGGIIFFIGLASVGII